MKISGSKLMKARESIGITRADLAVTADLSQVRIWQMETGHESNVNDNVAKAMARKLKITVTDLQA